MNEPRKPRLRWFQYSLRTLLLAVLLASIGMSWVAVRMQRARREREAVAAIVKLGGRVWYDYQLQQQDWDPSPGTDPPGPVWLRNLLGENVFASVVGVDLYGSPIRDADLGHLKGLTQLKFLGLNRTNVSDAGIERLRGLTQLKALSLWGTQVTDAGLVHLKGLTQLQLLDLGMTRVTDAGLEHLKGQAKLRTFYLPCTQVTDAGLEHLKGMKQLRLLDSSRTKVTDEGVKRLRQALPNCKIYRGN
jgi:Leucine-rich repeat (LRR) protein